MRGAEAVLACLREQGVDTLFGYPGGMILPLYDALYAQDAIRQVLVTHEQNAAHAADGYARATGRVGVCIATSGPGATNLVTGLATAYMDSIPVVAITGQVDIAMLGRDAFQETDILDVTMPVTKHNYKIKNAADLVPTIRQAFDLARSGRPGPVLLDVPRNLLFEEVVYTPEEPQTRVPGKPDADFIICAAEAAAEIVAAERPLVIVGGGVISAGTSAEVTAFIEKYHLPVVHTLMGMGAVSSTHPQMLGFAGMHGEKVANYAIGAADLVIAIGSRFADRQTGNLSKYTANRKFIHIDIDPAEIDKNIENSLGLAGDMRTILKLLMRQTPKGDLGAWWEQIRTWQEEYDYDYHVGRLTVPWALNQVAQNTRGKAYAYATDVGQHQMWAALHLRVEEPRTWLTSGGLGTMGYGLPAAMGAQLAWGNQRRVIHIVGDGGIKMTGNEYYTIAHLGLPVLSIIVDNRGLGMIRQLQKVLYDERYIACELDHEMDYVKYVESFGIKAVRVSTQEEFAAALKDALEDAAHPRVIVMDVWRSFVEPMAKGGARIDEFVDFK
ncbi:biosynthetic-type acetolactate synthase large subunit [Selenomonas sp. oral taxon 138]|uniref:biosynthetic-type acetolactate synthase large subunit n=1 Tax=Selenomonas sp. oral taxon 138 TaxID=712532 RepID=UPI0002A224EC|nr:biosynthetic-type acetolactate synthase large subunit [Selenomonas sp. oral taxon 138]EKX99397.1 acetolactate synthase, large subunit [Selenomonas sp. oral taxon 138 str. F0429]